VEYGTALLTPEALEAGLRKYPDAKAAIVVHYGGQAADLDGLSAICKRHGLKLIEDAAHAFPTRYKDRMIGSGSAAACFSFYANKTITTGGEGGMLATNERSIYERAKTMRLHGINRTIWDRYTSAKPDWEYDVIAPGFKYNLSDLAAAVGLAQLERADEFHAGRLRCANYYFEALKGVACLDLPLVHGPLKDHSWHLFPVVLKENAPVGRDDFIRLLAQKGIATSVHYKPLHRMTYYRERYGLKNESFPAAERIWRGCLSLPIYPSLQDHELGYICQTIGELLKSGQ
jgi:dTDP-4-amino-4,6-dideoxygalactose transaminase